MLNENIRALRLARSMSQVELAEKLSVTKQSVSNWENDNIQPSIEMLVKISGVFNVSTDFLLGLDDRRYVDVTGIPDDAAAHIQQVINDIKSALGSQT